MLSPEDTVQLPVILSEKTTGDYPFEFILFGDNAGGACCHPSAAAGHLDLERAWAGFGDYAPGGETCHVLSRTGSCVEEAAVRGGGGTAESVVTDSKIAEGTTTTMTNKRKEGLVRKPKVEDEDDERMKRNRDNNNQSREAWAESTKGSGRVEKEKGDVIHVRARRGQATDSHSLAERVRRERISERMKHLQDLVPGCNKIMGKAGMLDEIINYVQSLQRQVELLSMKLASLDGNHGSCLREEEMGSYGSLIMGNGMMNPLYHPHCSVAQMLEVEMGEEVDINGGIHAVPHIEASTDLPWLNAIFPHTHNPDSGGGMWMGGREDAEVLRWGR